MNQTCSLLAAIAIGAMMSGASFAQKGARAHYRHRGRRQYNYGFQNGQQQ